MYIGVARNYFYEKGEKNFGLSDELAGEFFKEEKDDAR